MNENRLLILNHLLNSLFIPSGGYTEWLVVWFDSIRPLAGFNRRYPQLGSNPSSINTCSRKMGF
jgi:hypothetical protein